jgi:thiamine-phosphate diphosphorylase
MDLLPGAKERRKEHVLHKSISGLYLLTEPCHDLFERVSVALQNGVSIVQYRHKNEGQNGRQVMACRLRDLCRNYQALFMVNDDPGLALVCQADGVHLGQSDASVARARDILGDQALIGRSTHTLDEAIKAEQQGADYIGFGCLFPTASKQDTVSSSLEELRLVRDSVTLPIVAIGGIHAGNAAQAIRAGADAVAVISAVMQAKDCRAAVRELKRQCRAGRAGMV